jgi:1,4-dihydroxy-2-naphthoate octaprenyltransferase
VWAALPVGALGTCILVANNLRDASTDAKANKRTLVVRFGVSAGRAEYLALLAVAYLTPVAMVAQGLASAWALLALLSLPFALPPTRLILGAQGGALNPALGGSARLQMVHSLLFAVGLSLR